MQLQHCTYQRKTVLFALIKVSTSICKREISALSSPLNQKLKVQNRRRILLISLRYVSASTDITDSINSICISGIVFVGNYALNLISQLSFLLYNLLLYKEVVSIHVCDFVN